MNEQELLAILLGQLSMGQFGPASAGVYPPSGAASPVYLYGQSNPDPGSFPVEPDILAENAQNVSNDQLNPPVANVDPSTMQAGPALFAGLGGAAGAMGGPGGVGAGGAGAMERPVGQSAEKSGFDYKKFGQGVSSAMNQAALTMAKQSQQTAETALKLISRKKDPRLEALMQPLAPMMGTYDDALRQLLAMYSTQGGMNNAF